MKNSREKILKIISIPTIILGSYIGLNQLVTQNIVQKENLEEYTVASILNVIEAEPEWFKDEEYETEKKLVEKYPKTYRIPGLIHTDSIDVTVSELLNDAKYWRKISPSGWDALPYKVREEALKRQFEKYDYALDSTVWNELTPTDWDKMPKVVRMVAFLKIAEKTALEYELEKYSKQPGAKERFQSILIQESYLNHMSIRRENKTTITKTQTSA